MINYNPNDKQKALDLANKLEFEETNITNNYMDICLTLFTDDIGGSWSIDGTYYGKYKLSYDNERICGIERDLEDQLDIYIEDERNSEETARHEQEEFNDFQDELWKNTNRNHF